jgi:hypothetical protein
MTAGKVTRADLFAFGPGDLRHAQTRLDRHQNKRVLLGKREVLSKGPFFLERNFVKETERCNRRMYRVGGELARLRAAQPGTEPKAGFKSSKIASAPLSPTGC